MTPASGCVCRLCERLGTDGSCLRASAEEASCESAATATDSATGWHRWQRAAAVRGRTGAPIVVLD